MQGEFVGVPFDTEAFVFLLTNDKREHLLRRVCKCISLPEVSPRRIAKLSGKLLWHGTALDYAPVMTRAMATWIGRPQGDAEWDALRGRSTDLLDALSFWRDNLRHLSTRPRPIRSLTGHQLHAFWLLPLEARPVQPLSIGFSSLFDVAAVVYVDTSKFGFGFACQARPGDNPSIVVRAPNGVDSWSEQVHRESAAFGYAAEFAISCFPGRTVIVATDCAPVAIAALRGSPSPILQANATKVAKLAAATDTRVVPLWFPGKELEDIGVATARSLHDVSLDPMIFSQACDLAIAYLGGRPTVDWFASSPTALLPRFWTRFHDPAAEGCDAFLAHSWLSSVCACGATHQETGFFFPPVPLLPHTWARIKQEGAAGIMIVPETHGPWWPLLEESSLASIRIDAVQHPFTSHAPLDPIYTSGRVSWHVHVFVYGHSTAPDQCKPFRQAADKPHDPVTRHARSIRDTFLASPLADLQATSSPE